MKSEWKDGDPYPEDWAACNRMQMERIAELEAEVRDAQEHRREVERRADDTIRSLESALEDCADQAGDESYADMAARAIAAEAEVERLRGLIADWARNNRSTHPLWKQLPVNAALLAEFPEPAEGEEGGG